MFLSLLLIIIKSIDKYDTKNWQQSKVITN